MTALNASQLRLTDNSPTERAAAVRTVLKRTTTAAAAEDQVLFMAGLHYKPEHPMRRIQGSSRLAAGQGRPEP